MSDDIDIEEHDVMDHVAVKQAFPDLSIVKQEVLDLDYDEDHTEPEPQVQETASPSKCFSVEVHNADSTTDLPEHPPVSDSPQNVSSTIEVNQPEQYYGNKIIIGGNTGAIDKYTIDELEEEARTIKTQVVLQDWGNYLMNSKSYCDECKILFPIENVYDYHKMVAHSHLVAVQKVCQKPVRPIDCYDSNGRIDWRKLIIVRGNDFVCSICSNMFKKRCYIYKHCLNVHKVKVKKADMVRDSNVGVSSLSPVYSVHHSDGEYSTNSSEPSTSFSSKSSIDTSGNSHICQLCKQLFASKDFLLNHLYEQHFPAKPYRCDTCEINFTTQDNLNKHQCNKLIVGDEEVTSTGYQCEFCMSYFLSKFNFRFHLNKYHKQNLIAVPAGCKITKITLICPFCTKSSSTRSMYNMHIKTKHPDKAYARKKSKNLVAASVNIKKRSPTHIVKLSNGYKCTICYKGTYATYKSAYNHKYRQHPNTINHAIEKVKTDNQSDSLTSMVEMEKSDVSDTNRIILLPKDIVYRCSKCCIHSTSIVNIETHIIEHENDSDFMKTKKCDKCNLHFTLTSLNQHMHQHDYSNEFSIIIVDISDMFLGKLLHKCPKCGVHFSESNLMGHYENCKKFTQNHVKCNQCEFVIESSLYNYHQKCHRLKYVKEDFIVINYICMDSNDQSLNINIQYMYCDVCKCYTHKREKKHTLGMCRNIPKDICQVCGIMLPEKLFQEHLKLHSVMKKLTFNDFSFHKISDGKPMNPIIPDFPKCAKCKIHFESSSAQTVHACNTVPSINCQICDINLTVIAHRLHNFYHNYRRSAHRTAPKILPKCDNPILLFLCSNCNIAIDDYDDVIVHCQKHDSIPNFRTDYRRCDACNLNFDIPSYERHFQKHASYNITEEDFTIITYDQYKFASPKWFKMLHHKQKDGRLAAAINRSIHKYTKFVKLHLFKSGNTELTLYKCSICDTAVASKTVQQHTDKYSNGNCKNVAKVQCKICNLKFIGSKALMHHREHFNHRLMDSYRIVKFNYANDRVYNRNLLRRWPSNATKCKYVYYLCRKCEVAMPKSLSEKHNCATSASLATKCVKCDLLISNTAIKAHMMKHKESPDFVRNNIKVIIFTNKVTKKENPAFKMYQCDGCKCVLVSGKNIQRHNARNCSNTVLKQCPHCKLLFNARAIEGHLTKHSENPNYRLENFIVIPFKNAMHKVTLRTNKTVVKKYIFYQCRTCGSALSNLQAVRRHSDGIENCIYLKKKLKKCSLCCIKVFNSMGSHMARHQRHPDMNKDSIKIIPFGDNRGIDVSDVESDAVSQNSTSVPEIQRQIQKSTVVPEISPKQYMSENRSQDKKYSVYKCRVCKVCVLSTSGVRKHEVNQHLTQYDNLKECKLCKFTFGIKSFGHHNMLHDKYNDYNVDNIQVIDFGSEIDDTTKGKHADTATTSDNIEVADFGSELGDNIEVTDVRSRRGETIKRKHDGTFAKLSDEKIAKLFKCSCGVHFLTKQSMENHQCLCAGDQTVKQNCSRCGLAFTPESLFSHLCTHHGNNKVNYKYDIIEMSSNKLNAEHTLYKCIICSTHFDMEMTAKCHVVMCSNTLCTSTYCYQCKLYFHDSTINGHKELHAEFESKIKLKVVIVRKKNDNTEDAVTYITIEDNEQVTQPNGDYMIYKCTTCDIHLINKDAIMNHLNIPHTTSISRKIIVCNECGLSFSRRALCYHKKMHHRNRYVSKSYAVEEYDGSSKIPLGIKNIDIREERADYTQELDKDSGSEELENNTGDLDNISDFELNIATNELENVSEDNSTAVEVEEDKGSTSEEVKGKTTDIQDTTDSELNIAINETENVNKVNESIAVDLEQSKSKKKIVSNILYKCSECNVHYLKETTVNKHTLKNHKVIHPSDIFECKFCGLNFRALTLTPHNRQHHYDNKFELKDFIIHEYEPVTRETVLKNKKATQNISIYNAIDANKQIVHNESSCVIVNKPVNISEQDIKNVNEINADKTNEIINNTKMTVNSSDKNLIIIDKTEDIINCTKNTEAKTQSVYDNNYKGGKDNIEDKALNTTENITQNTDCSEVFTVIFEQETVHKAENCQEIIVNTNSGTPSTQMYENTEKYVIDNTEAKPITINYTRGKKIPDDTKLNTTNNITQNTDSSEVSTVNFEPRFINKVADDQEVITITDSQTPFTQSSKYENIDTDVIDLTEEMTNNTENTATDFKPNVNRNDSTDKTNEIIDTEPKLIAIDNTTLHTHNADDKQIIVIATEPSTQSSYNTDDVQSKPYHCSLCHKKYNSEKSRDIHTYLDHQDEEKACPMCKMSFNISILNERHLAISDEKFVCCLCHKHMPIDKLDSHGLTH